MPEVDLPGVTVLSLGGVGPRVGFVLDPHRLALPCWAMAAVESPAVLLTLDRHFDLVKPVNAPQPGMSLEALDEHTRRKLDVRNVDHILAAVEAGVVSHVIAVARARPAGCVAGNEYVDARGESHHLVTVPTVARLCAEWGSPEPRATPQTARAYALIREAHQVLLDIDLDCFTSPSDADPTTVVPWPEELIREFVVPSGSEAFWRDVLAKCVALTFAREPAHCGGVVASGRLFERAARVVFQALLKADLP